VLVAQLALGEAAIARMQGLKACGVASHQAPSRLTTSTRILASDGGAGAPPPELSYRTSTVTMLSSPASADTACR